MMFDFEIIKNLYENIPAKIDAIKALLNKPLTLSEKILYSHLEFFPLQKAFIRGSDYVTFMPDRVAMQDATAQMALLQFMQAGKSKVAVPTSVHCDHLIMAEKGASSDLIEAKITNEEVYNFLASVSNKYGIGFWKPGAGIIHQVILENYAFPGGMMIGTDSHTPNAGGLGMLAIGVGGADAVDVMVGMGWELLFPKLIGVKLSGKLNGWSSAKDIILKIAGMLTVKGGTGYILEYFGEGAQSLSCTGKATICNMGAEIGATSSLFGFDNKMYDYLVSTGRKRVAELALQINNYLIADKEVYENPSQYFDKVIEIDLNTLEPHINGPFTPDKAWPISKFAQAVKDNGYPENLSAGLIGSCTNSSYEDITRAASILKNAFDNALSPKSELILTPGSEQVRYTIERDGLLELFKKAGAKILANACGPCIGQWKRPGAEKAEKNSIVTTFNRNFAKRNDGNPNTYAFVASPEITTAFVISGKLTFNPLNDYLINDKGEKVKLPEPQGYELPQNGFETKDNGYIAPAEDGSNLQIIINPESERLQLLKSFPAWEGDDFYGLRLLIKVKGKCTTDHISMAGPWLTYRGHLDNISNNLLLGALNAFNDKTGTVLNILSGKYEPLPIVARAYKEQDIGTIIVGDENYGEGSSREHAAMEPRHLGVKVVIVKSFARIHETNLKKQGILALTFAEKNDYDKFKEDDLIDVIGLKTFEPSKPLTIRLFHTDGSVDEIKANHSYNYNQIEWFKAGSALNLVKMKSKK
jgi:aconitate hydratase